jgi:hypothetical protein
MAVGLACAPSQEAVRVQLEVALDADGGRLDERPRVDGDADGGADRRAGPAVHGPRRDARRDGVAGGLVDPRAWAHPGHYSGGDVTGELVGEFILDWIGGDGMALGTADLLAGDYNGFNFTFRRGGRGRRAGGGRTR